MAGSVKFLHGKFLGPVRRLSGQRHLSQKPADVSSNPDLKAEEESLPSLDWHAYA